MCSLGLRSGLCGSPLDLETTWDHTGSHAWEPMTILASGSFPSLFSVGLSSVYYLVKSNERHFTACLMQLL